MPCRYAENRFWFAKLEEVYQSRPRGPAMASSVCISAGLITTFVLE